MCPGAAEGASRPSGRQTSSSAFAGVGYEPLTTSGLCRLRRCRLRRCRLRRCRLRRCRLRGPSVRVVDQ
ncbi:pentapeptide repeat-containing protein [Streptomyces sp. NPDC096153]|uniref:pentapeptide repeat-containing protein n=1 Tax=Streptomyces sp. NPDC096153 TaxID=3155548 RepID=UPI00332BC4CD